MTHTDTGTHTGTDAATDGGTGTRHRIVEPAHAIALAEHGPGWAIMWDDRDDQPVIVRPERGDDGTLLEICVFEHMFGLGGFCGTCGDAHNCQACVPTEATGFEVIAAHMTAILGDYFLSLDEIAAHMPLTLPYTRALAAYCYRRSFQGTRHGDAFHQRYVSPEGHHVSLIIPINPAPADVPAPSLTIEWIYLRPRPYTADHLTPHTRIPADTPAADVAELIAAHLAIHPSTPIPPGDTTDGTHGTDGTDGPDSPATPATA
ncbi:hypothetical protein ACIBEJ_34040 [Nonomuraea sp. NPDC050790]|uniref:hypothetical protein n=1 Tax=Nonomuraea sp. NPDC050790 TaxID=3364371 RepID=UPI0037B88C3F